MKRLWLFWFPLLFLPNLGYSQATTFGTLEFSDFLIGPYLVLLLFAVAWGEHLNVGRLTPWLGLFLAWALLSTVTISLRYGYSDDYYLEFGLLKIAKWGLYGLAGILTARALSRAEMRTAFHWSLVAASTVTGLSLWLTRIDPSRVTGTDLDALRSTGYSATNGTSVMAAILLAYLGGRLLTEEGTRPWRFMAMASLIVVVAGSAVSDGRGGWVAAIAAAAYCVLRFGPSRQIVMAGVVALVVVATLYQSQPEFKRQVDVTLFVPELNDAYQGTRNVGTLDDGGRFETWANEANKLDDAPYLGAGIYHRGGNSPLWTTGSHNFWLQMFLELGVVGGCLSIAVLVVMWRQATALRDLAKNADVPLKAALIAVIIGGFGGEYFYGGIILFTLLAVYAPTGGLPQATAIIASQDDSNRQSNLSPARVLG